mmetsp:Transcript_13646/g.38405  ORF Transcript_13646/g.38405 Transcript_13646/m.38405 type:complete len:355 (+) Transcript_13646:1276-2340(+)
MQRPTKKKPKKKPISPSIHPFIPPPLFARFVSLIPEDLHEFWNDSKGKPIDLQGSQQKVHHQKDAEEPSLPRSVVLDGALRGHGKDIGPQLEAHFPPSNHPVVKEREDKTRLAKLDDHAPQGSRVLDREVHIEITQYQKHGADFRAAPKEDGIVVDHLVLQRHVRRDGRQQMMDQKDRVVVLRNRHGGEEIKGLVDHDGRVEVVRLLQVSKQASLGRLRDLGDDLLGNVPGEESHSPQVQLHDSTRGLFSKEVRSDAGFPLRLVLAEFLGGSKKARRISKEQTQCVVKHNESHQRCQNRGFSPRKSGWYHGRYDGFLLALGGRSAHCDRSKPMIVLQMLFVLFVCCYLRTRRID